MGLLRTTAAFGTMNDYWRELLIDGYAVAGCAALAGYVLWTLAS